MRNNPGLFFLAGLLLVCALLFTTNAWADEGVAENIWTRDTLTGDWRGLRSDLSKHGIDVGLRLSAYGQRVTTGGRNVNSESGGTLEIWQREFRSLRMPYFYNLRTDPYEFAHTTSNTYWDWFIDHAFILYPMGEVIGPFLHSFEEYPPVQKPGSFTVGDAFEAIQAVPQQ